MPDITWLHGGRIIGRMRAKRQISEFSREMDVTEDGNVRFVISNVTKDSGGTYTVLASNRAGVVEKNFHVSVLSKSASLLRVAATFSPTHPLRFQARRNFGTTATMAKRSPSSRLFRFC